MLTASGGRWTEGIRSFSSVWIITNAVGHIEDISPEAASLLNVTPRGARGRSLPDFFVVNRPQLLAQLLRVADGEQVRRSDVLHPLERRAVSVTLEVTSLPRKEGERVHLRWLITPGEASQPGG